MMKKLVCFFLGTAWLTTATAGQPGQIRVQGNHFVTADGQPIVFRGLDTSDPDKLQRNGEWNRHYFEMARSWGANIVRIPVHPAAWRIHGKKPYLKLLDQGVRWAKDEGLYVIIDWHSIGNLHEEKFFPGSSELYPPTVYQTTRQETFDFWRTMARHYRGNHTVAFFELFNEPTVNRDQNLGNCTWPEWKGLMEDLIKTIRANGGTAVPLVAGFDFGYNLTPVAADPINTEGIGYVAHPYPMKAKQPWDANWTRDWGFVADKYPMILTEIGFLPPGEPGGYNPITGDESYGDAITSYCARRGISYSVWCFDPHWGPCLIKDWNFTPTRAGAYFKKAWQSPQPSATSGKAGGLIAAEHGSNPCLRASTSPRAHPFLLSRPARDERGESRREGLLIKNSTSPRPNDSLAPARSALSGLCFANSFRRFPNGSSPPTPLAEREKTASRSTLSTPGPSIPATVELDGSSGRAEGF